MMLFQRWNDVVCEYAYEVFWFERFPWSQRNDKILNGLDAIFLNKGDTVINN